MSSPTAPDRHPQARLLRGLLGDDGVAGPTEVAERAGVSPEAAGETLSALEREGLLERTPEGAYRAARLDSGELRELYPAVLLLESIGVRDRPPFDAACLDTLRAANERLRASRGDAAEAALADDAFHRALTAGCGNDRLLAVLDPVRRALLRYERIYMLDEQRLARSVAQHDAIIAALDAGDQARAAELVRENYTSGMPELTAELDARGEGEPA
jgi:DNA-binding GntR family transcriptional regulator